MIPQPTPELAAAPWPTHWPRGIRMLLIGALAVAMTGTFVLLAYQLILARVPRHRAALERLVQAQTGLDIRFSELGLRWGWYGPEAVFTRVELGEPGQWASLLRASELVVGFDAWRTLRTGQPQAGRIELVSPDIDVVRALYRGTGRTHVGPSRGGVGSGRADAGSPRTEVRSPPTELGSRRTNIAATVTAAAGFPSPAFDLERLSLLRNWRVSRIDIEGGTLRLPGPAGDEDSVTVQIRRAQLRRTDDEWSIFGLLLLPERLGRTARILLRLNGDVGSPAALSGSAHLEARRLLAAGCRELLAMAPGLAAYLPRGGSGDFTADVAFQHARIVSASGSVRAADLSLGGFTGTAANVSGQVSASDESATLSLERVRAEWRLRRQGEGWRLDLSSLQLDRSDARTTLALDVSSSGGRLHGVLKRAPLPSVAAVARWLDPRLQVAVAELDGLAQEATFDWDGDRPAGERLQLAARLSDASLRPPSHDYTLSDFAARVSGSESHLEAQLQSHVAHLELAKSQHPAVANLHLESTLRISGEERGWRIATEQFVLEHEHARLRLSGEVWSDVAAPEPRIAVAGTLTGADIPLVEAILGASTAQAFGAAASRLTAGRIQDAEFELRGRLSELPFGGRGDGFRGSLRLHDAVVSGGELWPDAAGLDARVEWHGAHIQATVESGRAGDFQLASGQAQWDASGEGTTKLTGRISGRLEDAIAWVRAHPQLHDYAPAIAALDARGAAAFDFAVLVPAAADYKSRLQARVAVYLDEAQLQAIVGWPPLESLSGSVVFDLGHLQRTRLTGRWLGGPVTLQVGERHEKGTREFAVGAQGVLDTRLLAKLADAGTTVEGSTGWAAELAYSPGSAAPQWHGYLDSSLTGVRSSLPEPLAKRAIVAAPLHLEAAGNGQKARLRVSLADRVRSAFILQHQDRGWVLERGAVQLGGAAAMLPADSSLLLQGHLSRLDLAAALASWQRLSRDWLPAVHARLVADELIVAGRSFDQVSFQALSEDSGSEIELDSPALQGSIRWTGNPERQSQRASAAEIQLSRLDVPEGAPSPSAWPLQGVWWIGALASEAHVAIEDLRWRGRPIGRLAAKLSVQNGSVALDGLRLVSSTDQAQGQLRCELESECRLQFQLESQDAAATLGRFGFRPELGAARAALAGLLQWRTAGPQSWLASLTGSLSVRLADGAVLPHGAADSAALPAGPAGSMVLPAGTARSAVLPAGPIDSALLPATDGALLSAGPGDSAVLPAGPADSAALTARRGPERESEAQASPFALIPIAALVGGSDLTTGDPVEGADRPLRFSRIAADFELRDGQAQTSDLHFDGEAEILIRGRTGLVSRDYDEQIWVLRGEDRLPAAVRRFATPPMAAAWLSLRGMLGSIAPTEQSRAALRLQGSWDDPVLEAVN